MCKLTNVLYIERSSYLLLQDIGVFGRQTNALGVQSLQKSQSLRPFVLLSTTTSLTSGVKRSVLTNFALWFLEAVELGWVLRRVDKERSFCTKIKSIR